MKKTIVSIILVCMLISLISAAFAEEVKKADSNTSVIFEFKIEKEKDGKMVPQASPKVVTVNGKKATVTMGSEKVHHSNIDEIKSMKDGFRELLMKIEVVPEVLPEQNNRFINVNMTCYYTLGKSIVTRTFEFPLEDGKAFTYKTSDSESDKNISITVRASINRGQLDKKAKGECK